jgi:hypothetical protein
MNDAEKTTKPAKPIERVTIAEPLKLKLQALCDQANESLQGLASISKSDIINLLLDGHPGTLGKSEIERLRTEHFDEVRFAQWMANRLREARDSGEAMSIMDLIERSKGLMQTPKPTRPARRSKKRDGNESDVETEDADKSTPEADAIS